MDGNHAFCCTGCHAVFNILSSSNQLSDYRTTPVFQQALRCGLISNPALLEQIRNNTTDVPELELTKLYFEISGMWCPACAEVIRLILLREKGVRNCVVDYTTDLGSVEFSPRHISKERIYALVQGFGYQARDIDAAQPAVSKELYLRFAIAAFCALNIMMFSYPLYATYFHYEPEGYGQLFAWLSLFTALPVLGYSAWPILRRFLTGLQVGLFGMETLVVIGVTTAFGLSIYDLALGGTRVYFDSMTVIIAFVLLGKIIEAKAKFSAKVSLKRLARAMPRRGRKRFADGSMAFMPLKEIIPGDIVVAFAGEKIVLDGIVIEGSGFCDESIMTGEALPVRKEIHSKVIGGAILQNGMLAFRATRTVEDSALHKIYDMVQQDIGHKSAYVRAADRVVQWFVPLVLAVAAFTALMCLVLGLSDEGKTATETALLRAVSVLLISCPCAIGIAAPLAESHVINGLAGLGAIVRNRGCLALFGRETVFVFDKTGTITEGCFAVQAGLELLSTLQLTILKGLASRSTHPIARAVTNAIAEQPVVLDQSEEVVGKGLRGRYEGETFYLGSRDFLLQHRIEVEDASKVQEDKILSTVYFASETQKPVCLVLGDRVREGVCEMLSALAPARTVLLSGDSSSAVASVARACGFMAWQAECNPLQKRDYIEKLRAQGHVVCMLGDGINDAPALTAANVGISVVSATDMSIQVSDLLLTTDRLQVIPKMRSLARKGHRIVQQNLFWAFFYNVIGIGMAVYGILSPIFAAFAMVASSLIVLFNAKRL